MHLPWFKLSRSLLLVIVGCLCTGSAAQQRNGLYRCSQRSLRVALAQIPVEDGDPARNMRLAKAAAREASRHGVDLFCLPEAADYGWLYQQARRDALPIPGRYTDFLAELAVRYEMWISGGCLEKDGNKVYNSAIIIDRRGRIVLKHRKIKTLPQLTQHLYDAGMADDIKTVDTEFGRIGLTICADNFDLDIPGRVSKMGAWLLIAPHGFAAAESEMQKNAVEYQQHISKVAANTKLWVVGTNAVLGRVKGGDWKGYLHCGCSMIARPDGSAAAVAKFKQPDLIIYDIPAENGTPCDKQIDSTLKPSEANQSAK